MQHAQRQHASLQARFLLGFLGLCFLSALGFERLAPVQQVLSRFFALLVLTAATTLGLPVVMSADNVLSFGDGGRFSYEIAPECSGLDVVLVYGAAVLASTSASWRRRLVGLLVGVGVILAANFARLLALAVAGAHGPWALFDALHRYGGSTLLFGTVALTWWVWMKWDASSPRWLGTPSRLRRVLPVAVLVLVPAAFWMANAWFGAAEHYMRLVLETRALLVQAAFGATPVIHQAWAQRVAVTYYAPLAGAAALFATIPRRAWSTRAALGLAGAAMVFAIQVFSLAVGWRLDMLGVEGATLRAILAMAPICAVLALWMGCAVRGRRSQAQADAPRARQAEPEGECADDRSLA